MAAVRKDAQRVGRWPAVAQGEAYNHSSVAFKTSQFSFKVKSLRWLPLMQITQKKTPPDTAKPLAKSSGLYQAPHLKSERWGM